MSHRLITPELVGLGVEDPGDKHAVIARLADMVSAAGRADRDGLEAAFEEREAQFATGMPGGIAIPHCRTAAVREASLALLRLSTPVDFGAGDGPADLVIGIAAPDESGSEHMKLLAKLSRALVKADFVAALRGASTPQEAADLVLGVVQPPATAPAAPPAVAETPAPAAPPSPGPGDGAAAAADPASRQGDRPVILAVTSCPTGIAHTYMAAEAIEQAGAERGAEIHTETQGSGGITPFPQEVIDRADALIVSADVNITGRGRFAGLPVIESDTNTAISDAPALVDRALAAIADPSAPRVAASRSGDDSAAEGAGASGAHLGWGRRIQQAVMTGVSYMIPFVAAGGLLTALGFLVGGYDVAFVSQDVALKYSLWNLPEAQSYVSNGATLITDHAGLSLYLGAVFNALGGWGMGFLVAALSGYIAFGLAGRPGIAPGFIGGALSVAIGAGFIGGLVTGILCGLIAMWLAGLRAPRWLSGLMPVAIIPLVTTLVVGSLMLMLLGRPLAAVMTGLQSWLTGMTGSSAILLGIVLGLMMCFDLGGPVNKAAYLFATAGLSSATDASYQIMAAVMAAGMVPPLAMALSTALRPRLYTSAERQNGTAAWLLGASFISEGAIPFAASDPLRVIPSMMAGGAVTGAMSMALHVGSKAPHGGIFVFFAVDPIWGFLLSIVAGMIVSALLVTLLKAAARRKAAGAADPAGAPTAA
ncbi:MAG: fructose-specific PTS transporter subunit EIIC [Actinomyces sp.]|jgi:PTS system fructose-specific IIC component|nr:fructose-specific PTS transporter subunit EIIC [Actinomyces sp.]MCI1662934.1 fructose-specific PTS transporter subunit EIIC [Actinomyces sp.]